MHKRGRRDGGEGKRGREMEDQVHCHTPFHCEHSPTTGYGQIGRPLPVISSGLCPANAVGSLIQPSLAHNGPTCVTLDSNQHNTKVTQTTAHEMWRCMCVYKLYLMAILLSHHPSYTLLSISHRVYQGRNAFAFAFV